MSSGRSARWTPQNESRRAHPSASRWRLGGGIVLLVAVVVGLLVLSQWMLWSTPASPASSADAARLAPGDSHAPPPSATASQSTRAAESPEPALARLPATPAAAAPAPSMATAPASSPSPATATPAATATPSATPSPTVTPLPTDTPTPISTATPEPSPTPLPPTATPAPADIVVPLALPEVGSVSTSRPVLALTFDAGGELGATMQTLQVLRGHGVHATFFVTGAFADTYPDAVRQMVADGHELANHTYSHRDLIHLPDWEIQDELERADAVLRQFSGHSTRPLMRMPYGSRDKRVLRVVGQAGYRSIYWTVDSLDWRDGATPQGVAARVLRNVGPGDIVVEHCATTATAGALPTILDGLQARGLAVVTVSDLLRDEQQGE